jgi:hypothetical protein
MLNSEPVWVRTRAGDILINGPGVLGSNVATGDQLGEEADMAHSSDSIESFGDGLLQVGGVKINPEFNHQRADKKGRRGKKKKKKNPNNNIPNLPFNMLRKLPGAFPPTRKKGVAKKKCGGEERSIEGEVNSVAHNSVVEGSLSSPTNLQGAGEFELEVVLPFDVTNADPAPIHDSPILEPILRDAEGSTVVPIADNSLLVPRDIYEAEKLLQIGEEMGINFQGREGEDVRRMTEMEDRDRMEKQEWENQRGDQ